MKTPKLPEYVHVQLTIYGEYAMYDETDVDIKVVVIPSKWLKFNGQDKYIEWSWNEKYRDKINARFGDISCNIKVIEWNLIQNMAYTMKTCREIGFDINTYYTQLKDDDIKYFNSTAITV